MYKNPFENLWAFKEVKACKTEDNFVRVSLYVADIWNFKKNHYEIVTF